MPRNFLEASITYIKISVAGLVLMWQKNILPVLKRVHLRNKKIPLKMLIKEQDNWEYTTLSFVTVQYHNKTVFIIENKVWFKLLSWQLADNFIGNYRDSENVHVQKTCFQFFKHILIKKLQEFPNN